MAKNRPRAFAAPGFGKQDARHWRSRVFKARYKYRGDIFEVRNWSVKIQHLGQRRTLALRSTRRNEAAAEACQLHRALLAQGWKAVESGFAATGPTDAQAGRSPQPDVRKLEVGYWAQRLIHREYTMDPEATGHSECSVRIDHGGAGHYFPLGTGRQASAAARALRIYQDVVGRGWAEVGRRHSREMTVALRWIGVPLCWTYTTIHTVVAPRQGSVALPHRATDQLGVAVVESDSGIGEALAWCLNRMEGFRLVALFKTAAEALVEIVRIPVQLLLVNQTLSDKSGTACLWELRGVVPRAAGVLYSVYEDSEELFRTTPGGAGTYLLKRTSPVHFLDPIHDWAKQRGSTGAEMALAAWQYFKDSFTSIPVGMPGRHLANLTHREIEVLELLSKGHPDKEIADQLGISIHTVHEHVRNIFEKLGAHNRTEAAVRFLQK